MVNEWHFNLKVSFILFKYDRYYVLCHNYLLHSQYLVVLLISQCADHDQSYNRHVWTGIYLRVTNHRPDMPSQNATAQSGAWEARQSIPEYTIPDRLSQSAMQKCTG